MERSERRVLRLFGRRLEQFARVRAVAMIDGHDGRRVPHRPVDQRAFPRRSLQDLDVPDRTPVREGPGERRERVEDGLDRPKK